MKLINPTDTQLNVAVAEFVAGLEIGNPFSDGSVWFKRHTGTGFGWFPFEEKYATSADAVLPLLEKHHWGGNSSGMSGSTNGYPHFSIWVTETPVKEHPERFGKRHGAGVFTGDSVARAFPRAACIALLRAHGVEVEITPEGPLP